MKLSHLRGVIKRRLLINFRLNPEVALSLLPAPFSPKLVRGWAMAGICLIRLEQLRPNQMTPSFGFCSDNAAHRIAVCWKDGNEQLHEGVYIPRRDSNSLFNSLVGGRLFPGEHRHASFNITDNGESVDIRVRGLDDNLSIDVHGRHADKLPPTSIFNSLEECSTFFRNGSTGYSETSSKKHLDGVMLVTNRWQISPFDAETIYSSYFSDLGKFPKGTVEFDCALIMRDIEHEWQALPQMLATAQIA